VKYLVMLSTILFFPCIYAEELNIPGGQVTSMKVSIDCEPCSFNASIKLLKLNDDDRKWAPSTGLVFHGKENEIATIGFRKLEGKQGLVSYIQINSKSGQVTTLKAIKSNLNFDEEYLFNASWERDGNVSFSITGVDLNYDIGFKPTKAEYMVSGFQLEFNGK